MDAKVKPNVAHKYQPPAPPRLYRRDTLRYAFFLNVIIVVGLFAFFINKLYYNANLYLPIRNGIIISSFAAAFTLITFAMLRYLNSPPDKLEESAILRPQAIEYIEKSAAEAAKQASASAVARVQESLLDDSSREQLIGEITRQLQASAAGATYDQLMLQLTSSVEDNERERKLRAELDETTARLKAAIDELNQRANLNLVFGIAISVGGVVALLVLTFSAPPENTWLDFVKIYVPRLTVAILIELFAYFFLKLYKDNLAETRYFHNEITNIAARRTALITSLATVDQSAVKQAITELLKTERNGTLTKSQTTVELAKARLEAENSKDLASVLSKIAEAFAKAKPNPDHSAS
ncbi:hypothetical protein AB4Y36_03595 [Paraburkholderia sp. BR10936]|uniref:hypothetical protein n=1 Tax=Paraburkholderia sp. BR10936 TaxID=3236993 RepID=UPI0034D2CBA5